GNFFECLGLDYSGPMDGHDIPALVAELRRLKKIKGPRLLHITTVKGRGLKQAELEQVAYHAPGKFDRRTGEQIKGPVGDLPPKFQDVFAHTLLNLPRITRNFVGTTPPIPTGSSTNLLLAL